jgi:hypothetical protein
MTSSTDTPMFDQRVADWLGNDPDVAPSQVLDTIVAALPSIPQRRAAAPWQRLGFGLMPRLGMAATLLASLVLLVLITLLGIAIIGSPRPTPTPAPTPGTTPAFGLSGDMVAFTSPNYGYSMDHPVEWSVRVATEALLEGNAPWIDSAGVDYTSADPGPSKMPGVIVGAARLSEGRTLDAWTNLVTVDLCGEPESPETIVVDGEDAALLGYSGCQGFRHLWTTVIHDGVGYHIVWIGFRSDPTQPVYAFDAQDRALFERMIATFRFPANPPPTPRIAPPASVIHGSLNVSA